jgi:hypothetical protein
MCFLDIKTIHLNNVIHNDSHYSKTMKYHSNACIYELYIEGHNITYRGQHDNVDTLNDRLLDHRSNASLDRTITSKELFKIANDPTDVKIRWLSCYAYISQKDLDKKEREAIIDGGFYDGGVYNKILPCGVTRAEYASQWRKKNRPNTGRPPRTSLTRNYEQEAEQKRNRRRVESEKKRIADFQAVPYDDMSWFVAISNNATTLFPLTKDEQANNRRRYVKKWNMRKIGRPLQKIHRLIDLNVDYTWFTHLCKFSHQIYPVSTEDNANRKRRIKVNWTLAKKYGPEHWKNISPNRKQLYDSHKK